MLRSRGVAVNMPACHAGDRRFDPGRDRHLFYKIICLKFRISKQVEEAIERKKERTQVRD